LDKAIAFTAQRLAFSRGKAVFAYFLGISSKEVQRDLWFDFVHLPHNMFVLSKSLILLGNDDRLLGFARIQPDHPSWRECFGMLLGLFNDVVFLERMQGYRDRLTYVSAHRMSAFHPQHIGSPVEDLRSILGNLKDVLGLTGKEYDFPLHSAYKPRQVITTSLGLLRLRVLSPGIYG
jgi:hypothetical protein